MGKTNNEEHFTACFEAKTGKTNGVLKMRCSNPKWWLQIVWDLNAKCNEITKY